MNISGGNFVMSSSIEESSRFIKRITYIFIGFGAFMVVAGLAMAFVDPAALFLCVFGVVFGGIGYLVHRGFSAPKGKMAVILSSTDAQSGSRSSSTTILAYVDENASDEEVEAYRLNWVREQWEEHPDWVAGTMEPVSKTGDKLRNMVVAAAAGLTVILSVVAYFFGDFFVFIAGMVGFLTLVLIAATIHRKLILRKFGASRLEVEPCPATLGEPLRVRLVTSISIRRKGLKEFQLALRCVEHVETMTRRPDGERRSEHKTIVHWKEETSAEAVSSSRNVGSLGAVASFTPPADAPAGSFGGSGMRWQVVVSADVPGLDYRAAFDLPIFDAEMVATINSQR